MSKVKSFLQNMSEKAEEILQKQLEKAKDTKEEKEVFSMKKHKEDHFVATAMGFGYPKFEYARGACSKKFFYFVVHIFTSYHII